MNDQNEQTVDDREQSGAEQSLEVAISSVRKAWDNENAWDHLEDLAESLSGPDAVSDVYLEALGVQHDAEVREVICQRAVNFHEEWFGDDPHKMQEVLARVIKLDPEVSWPYERLTAILTTAGMWDELFSIYDDSLSGGITSELRKSLLEDAANIAKDIADQPDRALTYLMKLQALDRSNAQRLGMIERLLERRESYSDLVELWTDQLEVQGVSEARETRVRIARTCLEKLHEYNRAFDVMQALLDENPGLEEGCALLDQLIGADNLDSTLRIAALDLLETNYETAKKQQKAVQAIEEVIELVAPAERIALHRRAASKLIVLGAEVEAIDHYSKILLLDPANTDALHRVRNLADKVKRPDLSAAVLDAAAKVCEDQSVTVSLMLEAAEIHASQLNAAATAIGLYEQALELASDDRRISLMIAQRLNELYDAEDKTAERIVILDRLAELDPSKSGRKAALEESATLSRQVGQLDRALDSLSRILEASPNDIEAMGAQIEILEEAGSFEQLETALVARASAPVVPEQRRADLVWAAQVRERELDNPQGALEIWLQLLDEYGPRADALEALNTLLEVTERFEELKNVLGKAISSWYDYHIKYFVRLGEVSQEKLNDPEGAADFFQKALRFNAADERARGGLVKLIEEGIADQGIVQVLVDALRQTDSLSQILELTTARLAVAQDNQARVEILSEAAQLSERCLQDPGQALEYLVEAFPLAPTNLRILQDLNRLAEATERWGLLAATLIEGAKANVDDPASKRQRLEEAGNIFEERLDDKDSALSAYEAALRVAPHDVQLMKTCLRLALAQANFAVTATTLVGLSAVMDSTDEDSFKSVEDNLSGESEWSSLLQSLEDRVQERGDVNSPKLSQVESKIALWYKDKLHDSETSRTIAARALERDSSNLNAAQLLATLQRELGDPSLTTTLMSIFKLSPNDLDPLFEAVSLPTEVETTDRRTVLMELWEAASRMWKRGIDAEGYKTVTECALFATEQLVEIDLASDHWKSAVQFLCECAEIVTEPEEQRRLLRQAADVLASRDQIGAAIDLLERIIASRGDDTETIALAAELLERNQEWSRLLMLRKRELAFVEDAEQRIDLRLIIARLSGMLEGSGDQLRMLKENLQENPGHTNSLDGAFKLLKERAKYDELVELCTEQANALLETGETRRAARLWGEISQLAEENLQDLDLAVEALNKVVELDTAPTVIDSLARIHRQRGELAEAAGWLEKRLEGTEKGERVSTALRLAKVLLQLEQPQNATRFLEEAFDEAPRNAEVRRLLFERYRVAERFSDLASALFTAAQYIPDESKSAEYLNESARLFFDQVKKPELAVGALERYMQMVPDDQESRRMLADALMAAENFEGAGEMYSGILESFGRRRSPARAEIHQRLAQVARARGNTEDALAQLDAATKMDNRNIGALSDLAGLARETGDLALAERAFRSLLLIVRRAQPEADQVLSTGAAEVLFELSAIAAEKGEDDKAVELTESALESLTQDKAEADRIQQRLLDREQFDMVVRVCQTRLAFLEKPRQKAQVFAEMAQVLDQHQERPKEALEAYFSAIKEFPSSPLHHDQAEELARRIDSIDVYEGIIEDLLEAARRSFDAQARCEILLRLARAAAFRHEDLDRAWDLFQQAETTGVREIDVWRLGAKLALARGQGEEQVRLLTNLSRMGASEDESETRADVLYRLAEIQLNSEESLESGIESFKQAFDEEPKCERAAVVLVRSIEALGLLAPLLTQYEKVARASEDPGIVLDFLGRASESETISTAQLREGAELAEALGEMERAEEFMLKAVQLADTSSEARELVGWAILGLATRRKAAGDLAGATKWLLDAVEVVDKEVLFTTGLQIAEACAGEGGDATLAVKIYEKLKEISPTEVRAWLPLSRLYLELGKVALLEALAEEIAYTVEDPAVRNELRLTHAQAIIDIEGREDDAVEILKNIQLDQPGHHDSLSLLSEHLERKGQLEDLLDLLDDQLNRARERGDVDEIRTVALVLGQRLEGREGGDPAAVYREALSYSPDDRDLMKALLAVIDPEENKEERLRLQERVLGSEDEGRVADLAFELAEAYDKLDDQAGHLRVLETAFNRLPGNARLREMLEAYYETTGDFGALVRLQKTALEKIEEPDDRLILLVSISRICRERLEDVSKELEALRQAVEIAPDDFDITSMLIDALRRSHENADGVALATDALERWSEPDHRLGLLVARGAMLSGQGEHGAAVADFEQAFSIDSETASSHLIAELKLLKSLQQESEDTQSERECTIRLAELYGARGENDERLSILREWLSRVRNDGEMWEQLMSAEAEAEHWLGAATAAKAVVLLSTGDKQLAAAKLLTDACSKCDQMGMALEGLEHVYAQSPDNRQIRSELKRIYEIVGALDKLAALLITEIDAVEDAVKKAELMRQIGNVYLKAGDVNAGMAALEQSLSLSPGNLETVIPVSDVYLSRGEFARAGELIDDALKKTNVKRGSVLAALYERKAAVPGASGDKTEELKWLEQGAAADHQNANLLLKVANLAEELEQWQTALKALKNLTLAKGERPISGAETFYRLGRISVITGDDKSAIFYVKRALKEDPEHAESLAFLEARGG